jgi:hypothetical protein
MPSRSSGFFIAARNIDRGKKSLIGVRFSSKIE